MKAEKEKENRDYSVYQFTGKEILKYLGECGLFCMGVVYLFYESAWAFLFMIPVPFVFMGWKKKQCIRERRKRLNYQFRDALNAMSVAVQAGYSVENAVSACTRDMERLYEADSDIVKEFRYIESQQRVSVPIEELFFDLGERSGVEDIENFASVFKTAKRTGGDMNRVLEKVARMLGDRNRGDSFRQKVGTDDHEPYACRYYRLFKADFSGIFKYPLRKSFWNLCHDSLPFYLSCRILAGNKDCGH